MILDQYLQTLPADNLKNERKIIQYRKVSASMKATKALLKKEPLQQQTKSWKCKTITVVKKPEAKEPATAKEEGTLVIEERKGLVCVCRLSKKSPPMWRHVIEIF